MQLTCPQGVYPNGVTLPGILFVDARAIPYSSQLLQKKPEKEHKQIIVATIVDASYLKLLWGVAKLLKDRYGITMQQEWTLEEQKAKRSIEDHPVFKAACEQAKAANKRPVWRFGTCSFGRGSPVWSLQYLATLPESVEIRDDA